jgi:hypothetical protein
MLLDKLSPEVGDRLTVLEHPFDHRARVLRHLQQATSAPYRTAYRELLARLNDHIARITDR